MKMIENQTSKETLEAKPADPTKFTPPKPEPEEEPVETQEEVSEQTSEETVEKETSEETSKTPEIQTVDYEAKFKASQAEAIRLVKENEGLRKTKPSNPTDSKVNVDEVLEITTATKGLTPEAVAELKLRSDATGKSLSEAREDENFVIWHNAYNEKVEKEKALAPSTNQGEVDKKPLTRDEEFAAAKTQKEKGILLDKYGLNPLKPMRDHETL